MEQVMRAFAMAMVMMLGVGPVCAGEPAVAWLRSDTEAFQQAKADKRYVLLYLEAVWCHWCHVMDHETYADPAVQAIIEAHYVPLRIDQDLRPDLANRYRDYGWPATVVFAADGTEIVKRQGYVAPDRFLRLLRAIVADPSPEAADVADAESGTPAATGQLDAATRETLQRRHTDTFDAATGGLRLQQKFLERDSVEYALVRADAGDAAEAAKATASLDAARALFDPAWGGVYQYSTHGDWDHPHYEKLATIQAEYLRVYALASSSRKRDGDRAAVAAIRRYLDGFLQSPSGAWYVSQDADLKPGEHSDDYFALDDAKRRARGMPRIDKHEYAQQTGMIAEALATWAELSGDATALEQARRAVRWAKRERALPGGGFRHDRDDAAGPYLADTLALGRAFLALYRADADRRWLVDASAAADFIEAHFRVAGGGYASAVSRGPIEAVPQIDENIALARWANLLGHYDGKPAHRETGRHALRWLATPKVALERLTEAGILLADAESAADPLHLTVVGAKDDPAAAKLFSTLQQLPGWYKRIEWWDRAEGPLPNADVEYPRVKRAAAFVCTDRRCSLPIHDPDQVAEFLRPVD
jgi:uncharacterized protein YyaL (SSP411 family)